MKPTPLSALTALLTLAAITVSAAAFDSGSDGSNGDLIVEGNQSVALPPDGVLRYGKIHIKGDATLTFQRNARNSPVTLLATNEVIIEGNIVLDGTAATGVTPGKGGPGGFDGGRAAQAGLPAGAGHGPGAGKVGVNNSGGAASHATRGIISGADNTPSIGAIYGDPLLLPIVGGSGGGGTPDGPSGGGGGGGAILIASNLKISLPTAGHGIFARGGENSGLYNDGSGGAIRLVAPFVEGVGTLNVLGGPEGGQGRVRVDLPDSSNARFNIAGVFTFGALMFTKLPIEPKLDLLKVAGRDIAVGELNSVILTFPSATPKEQTITVQARDFGDKVPIAVVLTPDQGERIVVEAEIDNTVNNPATVTVSVTFPVNIPVTVNAWTR